MQKIAQERKISLKELSRRAGIPYTTIYNMVKRDSSRVSPENLQKLADALGVEIGKLYGLCSLDEVLKAADPNAKEDLYKIAGAATQNIDIQSQREELESAFDKLNNVGREEAVKRIQELTRLSRYSYNLHDEVEWAADVLEDAQNAAGLLRMMQPRTTRKNNPRRDADRCQSVPVPLRFVQVAPSLAPIAARSGTATGQNAQRL